MNLTTNYLGLSLSNPLIVGASPFADDVDMARELQDAGASAVVMRSLFEEQIELELRALSAPILEAAGASPEAQSLFPSRPDEESIPAQYLRQITRLKGALTIPVIASLNGYRPGGWTAHARLFEEAGADAVELNLYQLVTNPAVRSEDVEADMEEIVHRVVESVRIPVSVKLSGSHASPAQLVCALENAGAAGTVLFNRFYQCDIDLDAMELTPQLRLSESSELLPRLRWLAMVSPHAKGSLAATGGIHSTDDVVKAILTGAHAVQMVSVLLRHGPRCLTSILEGLRVWMKDRGYTSIDEMRGAMNLSRCPDRTDFERANYMRMLQTWRV